jgi:hypothetical protein
MNYARIEKLLGQPPGDLRPDTVYRLRGPGFMDLVVEVLPPCIETGGIILSLTHYFEQNGDLCQDPEMVVRLFPPRSTDFLDMVPSTDSRHGRAEAVTVLRAPSDRPQPLLDDLAAQSQRPGTPAGRA